MEDDTRRFYDLTAEQTADEWYELDILMPTIEDLIGLLPEHPRVLDLGCGPGYESMRLASVGAEVVGVDFSTECIRVARERCPQCQFEVVDFRELGSGLGEFDGVFASGSLIHITPEELPGVMRRIADILKENGYLLTIVKDGEGVRESQPVVEGETLRRVVHLYTKSALESATTRFEYVRDGYLAESSAERGWRCYVFRVKDS
jgi:2-polyprenyl-3-methyl-5-hydroxy-6-metoxy-1,4-benzoquinol methylase